MPTSRYDDVDAKCPFFRSSNKRKVCCEGITDDCTICLMFISEPKRNLHRNVFCNEKYEYCEVYKMLMEKYEE